MSDDSSAYGPALPPHLRKATQSDSEDDSSDAYGPSLPPSTSKRESQSETNNPTRSFGPALPPGLAPTKNIEEIPQSSTPASSSDDDADSNSDPDVVGPLPPGADNSVEYQKRLLDFRLKQLANESSKEKKREEWMTVPPSIDAKPGAPKSHFLSRALTTDRDQSSWTDTPEDKRKKAVGIIPSDKNKRKAQDDAEEISAKKRDKEQEYIANKLKKKHKRDKSLIDMHTEKRKNDKAIQPEQQERKRFNRETDLQLSRMDSRQVKSVINQAKLLDSRFSSGSNKFL